MKKISTPQTRELRRIMKRYKLTQQKVAKLVGCARNTVSYWLQGRPPIPEARLRLLKFELELNQP